MILIDDAKYSCLECIRGHRSSLCRHHSRPLLQVRSKGRPNTTATGNPNHRIAVFAEEIASEKRLPLPPPPVAGKCLKNGPIVILKSSPKHVFDIETGQIVGRYSESDDHELLARPPPPVINNDSFIVTSTCCTTDGVTKKDKSCGCCTNKTRKNINKSKILNTYLKKRLNRQLIHNDVAFVDLPSSRAPPPVPDKDVYEAIPVESCSIPGSCCCDDNCACVGCVVHGNAPPPPQHHQVPSLTPANTPAQIPVALTTIPPVPDTPLPAHPVYSELVLYDTGQNLVFNSVKDKDNYFTSDFNYNTNITPFTDDPNSFFASLMAEQQAIKEEDLESPRSCLCPADTCDCYNCETHGIINGCKLDEFFPANLDNKFLSMLSDVKDPKIKNGGGCCSSTSAST